MASKIVKVAVTQAEPAWADLPGAVAKTCKLIAEAASNGAQLIAFPEVWIPGYPCWIWSRPVDFPLNMRYIQNSLRLNSPEMDTIRAAAAKHKISVSLGFSENDGNNSLFIAQCIIDDEGNVKAHRRKMKPTHMERTVFGDASGHCLEGVTELSWGRVGALSCWEHMQPLLKYNAIAQREDVHVAAWPNVTAHSGGPDLWSMSAEGCANMSQTYAIESGAFVLHCTAVISQKGLDTLQPFPGAPMSAPGGGSSAVFGPDGRRLTEPVDETKETIIYADLDFSEIVKVRMFADCVGHYSRPDLLWLGVNKGVKQHVRGEGGDVGSAVEKLEIGEANGSK